MGARLASAILVVLVLVGQASCAPKRSRELSLLPWTKFHVQLAQVAEKAIIASEAAESAQALAERIVLEVQSAKEGDTDRTGKDFEVEYGVMLWDPEVLPSHQAAVSSGPKGKASRYAYNRASGIAAIKGCQDQTENIPKRIRPGEWGWPCHFGGVVEVPGAASTKSAKPRNCMVFYIPDLPPMLHPSVIQYRIALHSKVVKACIAAAKKRTLDNGIIALSNVAECIMKDYPDGTPEGVTPLNKLRGVAVYVRYDTGDEVDPFMGMALPEGAIAMNCEPIPELSVSPFSICYAALFNAKESITRRRGYASPPQ